MEKTLDQIKEEVGGLLYNYKNDIKNAYVESEFALKLYFKIEIKRIGTKNEITPSLEFYPQPKTKSEKYKVLIDERQMALTGM